MNNCDNCQKSFEAKQPHQKFCSTTCRTENHYKRKFAINEPNNGRMSENTTDYKETAQQRYITPINDNMAIFDRLLTERESRMDDKIKLAQAEMRIQYLEQKLKDQEGEGLKTEQMITALTTLFTAQNTK